jgi:pimeloyl-ACP methyl ester carboxylesterase
VTRRTALWVLAAAGGGLGLVLLAIDGRMWDEGGPGIVGFELAADPARADRILAEWSDSGRDAARLSLWLDFLYLALYAAFWALAVRAARDLAARRGWARLARAGVVWPAALAAGGFDALENICLLVVLGGTGGAWPGLAAAFAVLKFLCLAVVAGYVALVLVRRFPRVAVALAATGAVALAVNTVLVERAAEPARPDIGRILELPAGDIQVREDGDPAAPPVVLIHGYGASMRWFDGITPLLARDLRVIRIDLLGFGGSEKPRDGYGIEEQADVVAQAMDRLGLRRAAIAGHSMGGLVATALAERHRARVTRLMLIGTAADNDFVDVPPTTYLAFWPVVGHATDTLIPEEIVHNVVEEGFAPGFDPPERLSRDPFERTTWSSLTKSGEGNGDYWDAAPVDERLRKLRVPATVVLGEQEAHARRSIARYNLVPTVRTVLMQALDHSPMVEDPDRTAALITAFALGR